MIPNLYMKNVGLQVQYILVFSEFDGFSWSLLEVLLQFIPIGKVVPPADGLGPWES